MHEPPSYITDEELPGGLRYTEHMAEDAKRACRICTLWKQGDQEPVSKLTLFGFQSRIGSVAVPAEGYAGVQTLPGHRRKGYVSTLLKRSLDGVSGRADVAFLYGIEGLYGKYGFTSSLPDSEIRIRVSRIPDAAGPALVEADESDIPDVVELFNREHAFRPWTLVRTANMQKRLKSSDPWHPAPRCLLFREGGRVAAYALVEGSSYGWTGSVFRVVEAAASSFGNGRKLLRSLRQMCWERMIDTLTIYEPHDGTVGSAARHWGCEISVRTTPDGEGMVCLLNRASLIDRIGSELERREAGAFGPEEGRRARLGLAEGKILGDSGRLMKLLLGYWRLEDAEMEGEEIPDEYRGYLQAWFPGGGCTVLPLPYGHRFDRY